MGQGNAAYTAPLQPQPVQQQGVMRGAPTGGAPPSMPAVTQEFEVVYPSGVAYRASPNYEDRRAGIQGPSKGAVVSGTLVTGFDGLPYLRDATGHYFLPLTTKDRGTVLLKQRQV